MDSGRHKLSENIWFVWSLRSFSGDKEGCHACPRMDNRGTEREDKARILKTRIRNFTFDYALLALIGEPSNFFGGWYLLKKCLRFIRVSQKNFFYASLFEPLVL